MLENPKKKLECGSVSSPLVFASISYPPHPPKKNHHKIKHKLFFKLDIYKPL